MFHNYAWYVQEVADKPHSPRIESGHGHDRSDGCTRRHSQQDPSVAATAVHMALLMLVYHPFGLGCVCEKAQQTFGGPWQTTTARSSKKKAGPGTSNGRLPRSPVEDKAGRTTTYSLFIRLIKAFRGYTLFSSVTSREHRSLLVDRSHPARLYGHKSDTKGLLTWMQVQK